MLSRCLVRWVNWLHCLLKLYFNLENVSFFPPTTLIIFFTRMLVLQRVYCGHEYTTKNLSFAKQVEPGNARVQEKLAWADAETSAGRPTVPSTLADELATNPFLRFRRAWRLSRDFSRGRRSRDCRVELCIFADSLMLLSAGRKASSATPASTLRLTCFASFAPRKTNFNLFKSCWCWFWISGLFLEMRLTAVVFVHYSCFLRIYTRLFYLFN